MNTWKRTAADPVRISIPRPCEADFAAMPKVEGGKFCGQCAQVVVDFTRMTDAQLIDWMQNHRGGCGTFRQDQLNRDLIDPVIRKAPFGMGWLLSLLMITGCIRDEGAQKSKRQAPGTEQCAKPEADILMGEPPLASGPGTAGARLKADTAKPARTRSRQVGAQSGVDGVAGTIGQDVMGGIPVSMDVPDPVIVPETDGSKRPAESVAAKNLSDMDALHTAGVYGPGMQGGSGGLTVSGARSSGTTIIIDGIQRKAAKSSLWRRIFGRR